MKITEWENIAENMSLKELNKTVSALQTIQENLPLIFDEFEGLSTLEISFRYIENRRRNAEIIEC